MRRVRRADRGATLVEYALVLSLFVVASITVAQGIGAATRDEVDNQATCLSTRPPPPACQLAGIDPEGGGAAGNGGADGGGGVPTTVPATIVAGPTTVTPDGSTFAVSVGVTLEGDDGVLSGEVLTAQVTITASSAGRAGQFFYVDCATDDAGRCGFTFDSRYADVDAVSFDIVAAGIDTSYEFDFAPIAVPLRSPG